MGAEAERMNRSALRSLAPAAASPSSSAWARMAWWMVGVALYQVGLDSSSHS
jgi:hypothetical protein